MPRCTLSIANLCLATINLAFSGNGDMTKVEKYFNPKKNNTNIEKDAA
jgi:hypothetical protein